MKNHHSLQSRSPLILGVLLLLALLTLLTACTDKPTSPDNKPSGNNNNTNDAQALTQVTPDNFLDTLLARDAASIHAQMTADFQQQVPLSDLQQLIDQVMDEFPTLQPASHMQLNGANLLNWTDPDKKIGITTVFDGAEKIIGLQFQDITLEDSNAPEMTKQVYDYPVQGDWFVFWGGDNVIVNYHAAVESQRFTLDLVQVSDHYSYTGDRLKNESYYAFGQPILAPADGIVVEVINNVPDNDPVGVMNTKELLGNAVVIDHDGEYSILAHLQQDSVLVTVGDSVKRGETIALAGNSGNSSEPHLHFQVSDGPDFFTARSLNIRWSSEETPVQGQIIRNK